MSGQLSVTDRRSITSAANGAKSKGPVTQEGKIRSSRNAEKHGAYSSAVVLNHESLEEYETLSQRYHREFAPDNQSQADLVEQMLASVWRIRRLGALESAAIDHAVDAQRSQLDAAYDNLDPETRAHFAYDRLTTSSPTLVVYNRFQASQDRIYDRALRNLRLLKEAASKSMKSQNEPK